MHPPGGGADRGEELVVGVDVGGTKVAAAAYRAADLTGGAQRGGDRDPPQALASAREPTPHDSAALLDLVASLVEGLEAETAGSACRVGVGFPSGIDQKTGRAPGAVNLVVGDIPLRAELERRLAGRAVAIDNDGNTAALAEAWLRSCSELVMLTLGTGVGGGVISGGRLLRGADGLGAELGHFPIRADGPPCPGSCPARGCVEALCSGQALERDARELAATRPTSLLGRVLATGGKISARDVTAAAARGDPDARWLIDRFARDLGIALAGYANVFQPRVIAIGGGLGLAADLFLPTALAEAERSALAHIWPRVRVVGARAGEAAGVLGAALVAVSPNLAG